MLALAESTANLGPSPYDVYGGNPLLPVDLSSDSDETASNTSSIATEDAEVISVASTPSNRPPLNCGCDTLMCSTDHDAITVTASETESAATVRTPTRRSTHQHTPVRMRRRNAQALTRNSMLHSDNEDEEPEEQVGMLRQRSSLAAAGVIQSALKRQKR